MMTNQQRQDDVFFAWRVLALLLIGFFMAAGLLSILMECLG